MANCKAKRCRCKASRLVSNGVLNSANECMDVCTTPLCGSPSTLGILAPVIYDEIGINLCTTFSLGVDVSTAYPTAESISLTVSNIGMTFGTEGAVTIEAITGRPNCYLVTLSDLLVEFIVRIYDSANRLLGTFPVTALYLPPSTSDPTYDEDTNPTAVELEIYAPYGISYDVDAVADPPTATAIINPIAMGTTVNMLRQGLNLMAIPKVLDFDIDNDTVTVGLSLFLQSLYFAAYRVPTEGRLDTPKGSIVPEEQSACMSFVEGSLLDLNIRPLDIGSPHCEEFLKNDCVNEITNGLLGCNNCSNQFTATLTESLIPDTDEEA